MVLDATALLTEDEIHFLETVLLPEGLHNIFFVINKWNLINLKDIWAYRELLFFLTWRDVKVRYKQTLLGASWAILQPFFTMVVFSLFFGRLAKIPSDGIPYPIFSFVALVPWTFFASSVSAGGTSITGNLSLVNKVYFPREILPLAAVGANCVHFLLQAAVLLLAIVVARHRSGDQGRRNRERQCSEEQSRNRAAEATPQAAVFVGILVIHMPTLSSDSCRLKRTRSSLASVTGGHTGSPRNHSPCTRWRVDPPERAPLQ